MAKKKVFVDYNGKLSEIISPDIIDNSILPSLLNEAEIDFGSKPVSEAVFTITDGNIDSSKLISVSPNGKAATGRIANDYSWETFSFSAIANTGNFTLYANCSNGTLVGKRKILYTYQ